MTNPNMHQSAYKHVSGKSVYVDDLPRQEQELCGYVVYSPLAHAHIKSFDLGRAKKIPGVQAVLAANDIPGENNLGPIVHDEPCLAKDTVNFIGQAVFLIAAESDDLARQAAAEIQVEYQALPALVHLEQAMQAGSQMGKERKIARGNVQSALNDSPFRFKGRLRTGAQEHWYLETQSALCLPGEDEEFMVYSSSQNPSETQAIVAEVLNIPRHAVTVEVRRMGGAFGGKETQANHIAAWCALLSFFSGRPVRIRLFRDDDQIMTGKRHPFIIDYEAGFNGDGKINALKIEQHADGGAATDLSFAILERAMFHAENAYFIPHISITGKVWKTNLPSNTAFRGFGGPQGMAAMENIIDRIARALKKDALEIRRVNYYGLYENNVTPYGQELTDNHLPKLDKQLIASSNYEQRRKQIDRFNQQNEFVKRGMACTPVKFGISFTTSFLNQAGALIHIYQDGTIQVNHGGTEMGQGLHTKMRQVAAAEFGLPPDKVIITPTNTSKVPNTSATAASSGSDLNGMAVKNACERLKYGIALQIAEYFNTSLASETTLDSHILFRDGNVFDATDAQRSMTFAEAVKICYLNQLPLSSTGFYKTPGIHFDREKGQGHPFYYFAYGMAVSEVELDLLTGAHKILRTDILHDVGDSLNPDIDMGQIQGGFIQGVGWCTTEICKWDARGHLMNHSPDTYKIPGIRDIPKVFRVHILQGVPNPGTIRQSKAVGEPPFMLALSVWLALKDALSAAAEHTVEPELDLPASNEALVLALEKIRHSAG